MADYASIDIAANSAPVQVAAATEAVVWFARQGAFALSVRSTVTDTEKQGMVLYEGIGYEVPAGKAVWYWGLGGPATISREAR